MQLRTVTHCRFALVFTVVQESYTQQLESSHQTNFNVRKSR